MNRICGIDVNTIPTLCVVPNYNALQIKRNLRGNTMSINTIKERTTLKRLFSTLLLCISHVYYVLIIIISCYVNRNIVIFF